MAVSSWGVNANEAVKLWSRKLFREALKETWCYKFTGKDSNALCQIKGDTQKDKGDRIRATLRMQLSGTGRQGDATLEGYEEALSTFTDDIYIDQLRHAVRSGGKMSEQRVPFSVREEARMGLQDWWSDRIDTWFINQLTGNTTQTDTRYTGNQAALAPDSAHHLYAGDATVATAETNLSANDSQIFSLAIIDKAVLTAKTLSPVLRSVKTGHVDANFVMFISPEQHYDLRRNTTSMEWADIQKAAIQGGQTSKNPIFTGSLGLYGGVILHESSRMPLITTGSGANTGGRAVLCGAQAAVMAFGGGHALKRMSWKEESFDYGNQLGVSAGCIAGLKKTVFNSADFATIVCSTAHSAAAKAASARD